ncbi:uncharacterized protein [Watersipora subatra]|uniref:uncharacterized protein n=1 Tax=Watersipora subatra TaxID=2589382 RepID=UPI00355C7151
MARNGRTTPSAQVARWLEIFSEFTFTIEHRPGSKHGNADGLSKRPCHDCTKCDRVTKQFGGPNMGQIRHELSKRARNENPVCTRIAGEKLIAQECADDLLDENRIHEVVGTDCKVSARSGPESLPAASFIVANGDGCCMVEDSSTSDNCQNDEEQTTLNYSSNQQGGRNQPSPTPQSDTPSSDELCQAQLLPSDIATIYNAVKNQQSLDPAIVNFGSTELRKLSTMLSLMRIREDQVLVTHILVGKRSRKDAVPLPDATAPITAEALDSRIFCYFGLPEELHSDRGTQFKGDLLAELCDMWRINTTRTTAYRPQSNGVVERGNRTLGDSLRCLLLSQMEAQENWDIVLPQVMRAFRATPHTATEETANYLMLGRECRLLDQLIGGTHDVDETTRSEYASQMQDQLDTAYQLIRTQQMLPPRLPEQEDAIFKEGDLVLMQNKQRRKGIHPKLLAKFNGPFIVKVFDNGTYKVAGQGTINECRRKLFMPASDPAGKLRSPMNSSDVDQSRNDSPSDIEEHIGPEENPASLDAALDQHFDDLNMSWEEQVPPPERPRRTLRKPPWLKDHVLY